MWPSEMVNILKKLVLRKRNDQEQFVPYECQRNETLLHLSVAIKINIILPFCGGETSEEFLLVCVAKCDFRNFEYLFLCPVPLPKSNNFILDVVCFFLTPEAPLLICSLGKFSWLSC